MKTKEPASILVGGLLLIGGTALLLSQIDRNRRVGEPGLVMIGQNVYDEDGNIVNTNTVALPVHVRGFVSRVAPITRVELDWLPPDTTYARRQYISEDNASSFQVNVVMMGRDRSSIHKPQICLSGQGWTIDSEAEDSVLLAGDFPGPLPVYKIEASQERMLDGREKQTVRAIYTYWFVADGSITARHSERMLWSMGELFKTGTLQRWAYVSVLGFCLPGQEEKTYREMKEFISVSAPTFHRISEDTVISAAEE